jgi:hypothetical protein
MDAQYDADDDAPSHWERALRTTITIEDGLLERARAAAGEQRVAEVVRTALEALVEREASRRLARLGGTMPNLTAPPRRRGAVK